MWASCLLPAAPDLQVAFGRAVLTGASLQVKSPGLPSPAPPVLCSPGLSLVTGCLLPLQKVANSTHPIVNYSFSWEPHSFLCLLQTSGFVTQPKSRDVRGDRQKDWMTGRGALQEQTFSCSDGELDNPEKPDKERPISGDQQIQFGTKHNFHGLKSAT